MTVTPPAPGERDIRVDVRRQVSGGRKKSQKLYVAFLALVVFLLLSPLFKDGWSYFRMSREHQGLRERNEELLTVKETLLRELADLDSPEVIEKLAREELGMVRPGESKVYRTIPTDDIPARERLATGEALH
ncbi:MAG: septum formation initiator family protein [Peptococcaceae bacterium]|nr:septum formation initiator family protein [Peptococcaceae bacterium]